MLSKPHRLAKTKDVKRTFAQGRGFFNPLLTVKFAASPAASRFTVVVSTKVSKNATKRNRLKRIIREFVRLRLPVFKTGDYAIVLKPRAGNVAEQELMQNVEITLRKAGLLKNINM